MNLKYDEKLLIACVDQAYMNTGIDTDTVPMREFDKKKDEVRVEIYRRKGEWIDYLAYNLRGIKVEGRQG